MRRLMNLKLWVVVALLWGGMSSCLDSEDNLRVYVQWPYALQNANGTFTPQVRIIGNDLESAYLNLDGKRFDLTALSDYIWEINHDIYTGQLDSIPAGYYSLTAVNSAGKSEVVTILFPQSKKKMGEVNLAEFEYDEEKKEIRFELADSVQNASAYYLMVKEPIAATGLSTATHAMWIPCSASLNLTGDRKLSATISLENESLNGEYYFAVGAAYESTIRLSETIRVRIIAPTNP